MGRLDRQNGTGDRCIARNRTGDRLGIGPGGRRVALNYQSNDAKAQEVADEIAKVGGVAMLVKANLADPQEARAMVKQVAEQFGQLDVLVNNAGITRDTLAPQDDRRGMGGGHPDQPQRLFLLHLGRHSDHDRAEATAGSSTSAR